MSLNTKSLQGSVQEQYGLDIDEVRLLGISENHAYELSDTSGQRYFCRVHIYAKPYADCLASELELLQELARKLPGEVPVGIRTKTGDWSVPFQEGDTHRLLMLFSWLPGVHRSTEDVAVEDVTAMAESTAAFHKASQALELEYQRPVYDYAFYCGKESFYHRSDLSDHISDEAMEPFIALNSIFERFEQRSLPNSTGLIHYDLHLGNFLFEEGRARIIDFDECGRGHYLFDLAHVLFALREHPNYTAFESAFIDRYQALMGTSLPRKDLQMFIGLQAVSYVHYFFRLHDRSGGAQNLLHMVPGISASLKEILKHL